MQFMMPATWNSDEISNWTNIQSTVEEENYLNLSREDPAEDKRHKRK